MTRPVTTAETISNPPSPTGEPAIAVRGLTRRFGAKIAVDSLTFDVPRGSFFALLGPNGAGKTTTFRMLTGLLEPSEGDATVLGRSVARYDFEVKRAIGVVPDDLALFDRLTLWEHVTLVGQVHGLEEAEVARRGASLLELLDLAPERETLAGEASTGMRKKLALALALLHRPELLFLDEPFEAIDPISARHLRSLLQRLARRGVTVFLTSHILEIVSRVADHAAILSEGRLARTLRRAEWEETDALETLFLEATGGTTESEADLDWLL